MPVVVKDKKAVVFRLRKPKITSVIPTAKPFKWNGDTYVAVPHNLTRLL